AVYAFCRESDDRVDGEAPVEEKSSLLVEWRDELRRCYRGQAVHPVTQRLAGILQEFPIPEEYFQSLLDGMEMDLTKNRYATFGELYQYCYRAAGVVGLMCLNIFGVTGEKAKDYAVAQGVAFQLTNILRDIRTDLVRDRIYLPLDELKRSGYGVEDLRNGKMNREGLEFFSFQVKRCKEYYAKAAGALPHEEHNKLLASRVMAGVYRQILAEIEADPARAFREKIRVPKWRQAWIAMKTLSGAVS